LDFIGEIILSFNFDEFFSFSVFDSSLFFSKFSFLVELIVFDSEDSFFKSSIFLVISDDKFE